MYAQKKRRSFYFVTFTSLAVLALAAQATAFTLTEVQQTVTIDGVINVTTASTSKFAVVRDYMNALGIDSLDELGTIELDESTSLSPGLHLLQSSCGRATSGVTGGKPYSWSASCTSLSGVLSSSIFPALAAGSSTNVTRYTGTELTDTSVILADKVVFDGATLILSDSVKELWIVAETIESSDSEITWSHAGTQADDRSGYTSCAADGRSYDYNDVTSASAFDSPDGGNGTSGSAGATGNSGLDAPEVYFVVKYFTKDGGYLSMPSMDMTGQDGGKGQTGQCAGDGGDGAKGATAKQNLVNCTQGPGYGGDGGNGGTGGRGGTGGTGGDGGDIHFMYVDSYSIGFHPYWLYPNGGGENGTGGSGGTAGDGGRGGEEGDPKSPYCWAQPERAGDDGSDGSTGSTGSSGSDGTDGTSTFELITEEEWEAYFTAPYIVSAAPTTASVGATVTFSTENVSGDVTLELVDDIDGSAHTFTLSETAEDEYGWTESGTLEAGRYTVTLTRNHDGKQTNTYGIELTPVIDGITFSDPYDALPGGTARLVGSGLRSDAEVVLDGVSLGSGTYSATGSSGKNEISFTLPVQATSGSDFERDGGVAAHAVYLDQPYPLANSSSASLSYKRFARLTFRPSENAYPFSNGELTDQAKIEVAAAPWRAFVDTFGASEVNRKIVTKPVRTLAFYFAYKKWWDPSLGSANCMGMSANVLNDYFHGVTGVNSYVETDVAYNVALTQGHLLGQEVLFDLLGETLDRDAATGNSVDRVVEFLETATDSDGDDAPVLIMVPHLETYTSALEEALMDLEGSTCLPDVAACMVTNGLNNCGAELEACGEDIEESFGEALSDISDAIGSAHALAPYMVAYENVGDALPSRVYFYDSNYPLYDTRYMEIGQSGGAATFDYSWAGWGTTEDEGWILATGSVAYIMGDATIPLTGL
ncbi:MAG: hypothetical protein HYV63_01030 [Candidatus Schekmanbacteria bacterium]|nr:hypothetical protein [Candidatus Schekmanbacteria bacterium]